MTDISRSFGAHLRAGIDADAEMNVRLRRALGAIADAIAGDAIAPMEQFAGDLGRERAAEGRTLAEVQESFVGMRSQIWTFLHSFLETNNGWAAGDIEAIEAILHRYRNAFLNGFSTIYQEIQQDLALQAEQIEAQRSTISELSTPILPLYEGIIALPLVGAFDSYRAAQVMERLLEAVSALQADIVIIDITGVPVVDTGVANYLLQTARAAQLVGAEVVLVGIGAEIAQTIVQLGVDLSRIMVYANLQAGISYALGRLGMAIGPK